MNDHQHAAIEQARIAWHDHQFEHDCYGQDCAEDRRLYRRLPACNLRRCA